MTFHFYISICLITYAALQELYYLTLLTNFFFLKKKTSNILFANGIFVYDVYISDRINYCCTNILFSLQVITTAHVLFDQYLKMYLFYHILL